MRKLKLIAFALALLALAHPAMVGPVVGTSFAAAVAVIGWALGNLSLALTLAAAVTLARLVPGFPRWFARAWDSAIDAILPVKPTKA